MFNSNATFFLIVLPLVSFKQKYTKTQQSPEMTPDTAIETTKRVFWNTLVIVKLVIQLVAAASDEAEPIRKMG